jgi:hypothetical protein
MVQEPRSNIRPVWLLGGGAALAVMGICALISVCAAAALLWLSAPKPSSVAQATQAAVVQRQAATLPPVENTPPIVTATSRLPTLLPTPGQMLPAPTLFTMPTQISGSRPSPDQAVRTYFQLVSEQRYDLSWPMLSEAFKQRFNCCAPNYNYSGYTDWWNSVNYVEFGNVNTVSQNGDRAVVYAELIYVMNDGRRSASDSNPYIQLVYDPAAGGWRFDDKRGTP